MHSEKELWKEFIHKSVCGKPFQVVIIRLTMYKFYCNKIFPLWKPALFEVYAAEFVVDAFRLRRFCFWQSCSIGLRGCTVIFCGFLSKLIPQTSEREYWMKYEAPNGSGGPNVKTTAARQHKDTNANRRVGLFERDNNAKTKPMLVVRMALNLRFDIWNILRMCISFSSCSQFKNIKGIAKLVDNLYQVR